MLPMGWERYREVSGMHPRAEAMADRGLRRNPPLQAVPSFMAPTM